MILSTMILWTMTSSSEHSNKIIIKCAKVTVDTSEHG